MKTRDVSAIALVLGLAGCGHYYHGYYPGALALDAPTVVVGDESTYVSGTLVTGTASGSWTVQNGWSGSAVVESAPSTISLTADASCSVPRVAATGSVRGDGVGLPGLVGSGIHVSCSLCDGTSTGAAVGSGSGAFVPAVGTSGGATTSTGAAVPGDTIAALALLSSLSPVSLGGDATVATSEGVRLEASLAHDALPAAGGESAIVVRAIGGAPPSTPTPVRIHLVVDTSASMEMRWDEVREAALALVDHLRAEDELEIVAYATDARVVLPPTRVGDGAAARAVIRAMSCGGQTNIEAGLRAAYGTLVPDGGSIVVLLSDGVPEGGYATPAELGALAGAARASAGATTISIGLGGGFHAGILRAIARRGGGDFRIAPTAHELGALLQAEVTLHTQIVAREVAFDLTLAPGVRVSASLDASSLDAAVAIDGSHLSIRIGSLAAGETRTIVVPISVSAPPGAIATVSASARAAGQALLGQRALAVREAPQPIPAGGLAATLDADLSSALVAAATAVENGDASTASATLRAHADLARRLASGDPAILARAEHTWAFAAGIDASVPSASWGARRQAAQAMMEWSVGLGR